MQERSSAASRGKTFRRAPAAAFDRAIHRRNSAARRDCTAGSYRFPFLISVFPSSSFTFLLTRMRRVLIHETEYALRQHGWRKTESTERRIRWLQKRKQRRRSKLFQIWVGTIGDAAMHPRSFFGPGIFRKYTAPTFLPHFASIVRFNHSAGSRSGASSARGVSSIGSNSIISSPVAAPSSLNLRAEGSTRDSSEPTALL